MKKPRLKSKKNIKKLSLGEKKAYLESANSRIKNFRENKTLEKRLFDLKQSVRLM